MVFGTVVVWRNTMKKEKDPSYAKVSEFCIHTSVGQNMFEFNKEDIWTMSYLTAKYLNGF